MRNHGTPYYLKINIESSDLEAVEVIGRISDRILERLRDFGCRRFMLVDQVAKNAVRRGDFFLAIKSERAGMCALRSPINTPGHLARRLLEKSFDQVMREYSDEVASGTLTWHDFHAAL